MIAIIAFVTFVFFMSGFVPSPVPMSVTTTGNGIINTLNGSPNLHWEGTITNNGMATVHNVRIEIRWYNQNHNMVGTGSVDIEDIPAQTSKNISFDVSVPTPLATSFELESFWTP